MSDGRMDFYTFRKNLVETKKLFVDRDFPPELNSISPTGLLSASLRTIERIEWKRPINLSHNPRFVTATTTRSDLDQGQLGDCWFIAAASLLVNGPDKQFRRVVPLDQGFDRNTYAGIFHFNFWWYGQWKEIIIDDYLPTDGYNLLFCYNREEKDEYWGALLEKAYAKLRGSYMALQGGYLSDALVDFTGGLGEVINIQSDSPDNIYDILWKCSKLNSMLGASIRLPNNVTRPEIRRQNGLYMGHAYSITAMSVVPYNGRNAKLLRLRNPWGRKEWLGPWSDNSPEIRNLSMDAKRKLNIVIDDDGEFWISLDDFLANFDECHVCHLQPDAISQELANNNRMQQWNVTVFHDAWIKGVTAGGCGNPPYRDLFWKNPQFFVELKDPDSTDNVDVCTMIVSLMEKEKDNKSTISIGFNIFKIKNPRRHPIDGSSLSRAALVKQGKSGDYQQYREVVRRFELAPGSYVIIPATFYPHTEAEFMLRIYTEKEAESEVFDESVSPSEPGVPSHDNLTAMFTRYAGEDGKMDYKELRQFLTEATTIDLKETIEFNTEACRCLVTMTDTVFKQFDADNSNSVDTLELGTMLSKLGFPVSRMVLTSIVRRYGGRNRKINLEDFIIVLTKLITMFSIFMQQQLKTDGTAGVAQFTRNEVSDFK